MSYVWLIFALLSAFTAGLVAIFGKVGLKGVDTNLATAIRAVVMAVFLIGVITIQGKLNQIESVFQNTKAIMFIVFSGLAGALSWLFYFVALKYGSVTQVVSIDRLSVVFAAVFALFILGEEISLKNGIGLVLIVAGAILIAVWN